MNLTGERGSMTKKIIINIAWDGPFTQQEVKDLTNDTDYGVYRC